MKVGVVGANGQLGVDVMRAFAAEGHETVALNHEVIDITESTSVDRTVEALAPDVIVNTAAYHHLGKCEENPRLAFDVNSLGARNLALAANQSNATLVHVSTDYVFDGKKNSPYVEGDIAAPLNVYGNSKLSGEQFVSAVSERFYIVRVSGLYGQAPCRGKGGNFVELMLKLARERDEVRVVNDEMLTPTSTKTIAQQIVALVETKAYGLYHATSSGSCSWYEFAAEIFRLAKIKTKLAVALPGEFTSGILRPKYSVLENQKLQLMGRDIMPTWQDGLAEYLAGRSS